MGLKKDLEEGEAFNSSLSPVKDEFFPPNMVGLECRTDKQVYWVIDDFWGYLQPDPRTGGVASTPKTGWVSKRRGEPHFRAVQCRGGKWAEVSSCWDNGPFLPFRALAQQPNGQSPLALEALTIDNSTNCVPEICE